MPDLSHLPTPKRGVEPVSIAFCNVSIGDTIARALRGLSAKAIAARVRKIGGAVSARTVESWKQAKRTPRAPHILAMLADDTLCALLLEEVNPQLAHQAKILETKKKLNELEGK